jgi:bacteriorhodopsin
MLLSALVMVVWSQMIPQGQRVFHQLGVIILVTASVAYFCLASALGRAAIPTEFAGANGFPAGTTRSIWVSVANLDARQKLTSTLVCPIH